MNITLEVTPEHFATNNEDALEAIMRIDARRADCAFTLSVIKKLIEDLRIDMTREEIASELGFKLDAYAETLREIHQSGMCGSVVLTRHPELSGDR